MTIARYVLDTNIITAILKKHLAALGVTVENWRR